MTDRISPAAQVGAASRSETERVRSPPRVGLDPLGAYAAFPRTFQCGSPSARTRAEKAPWLAGGPAGR